ncbi:MAG TPA: glycosyltransferase [Candidatus Polarisedimenticolia bacterium]|nr:glycosyltransferase [Candidatus Polarisedimenticolia bacterium]
MRPIQVLHVVEALGLGGLERVVGSLVRHASVGVRTEVLALAGGGPLQREIEAAGARVRRLALRDYYPGSVLRTARALRAVQPDILHTHGHFAGTAGRLAARLAGVRGIVHHLHTSDTTLRPRHRRLERLLARGTRRILCCSQAVARHAREDLGLPEDRMVVVRNGIDPAPASTPEQARALLPAVAAPIVGCVGGLVPHKGQAVLLRALASPTVSPGSSSGARPGPSLVLVGDGPERPALEALARDLGIAPRVHFLGVRPDARALLPAFALLAAPSLGREGLGLSVLEGMDAGLPVVASRTGGLTEVVEDGVTGQLVPEGDAGALAAAIASLLADPHRARAWGEAGRRRVEREFRAAAMTSRIEAEYDAVLEQVTRAA